MSLHVRGSSSSGNGDAEAYKRQFRRHCHFLLWKGYEAVRGSDHSVSEEDLITLEIVKGIKEFLTDPERPRWTGNFVVSDQLPQSNPHVDPNARPIIDIQMESTASNRPVYHFEAKRLRKSDTHSVSEFVGAAGLGGFLDGSYARDFSEGGMIGYVQSEPLEHWQDKISRKLCDDRQRSCLTENSTWAPYPIVGIPAIVFSTRHVRHTLGEIDLYHTFLDFRQVPTNA